MKQLYGKLLLLILYVLSFYGCRFACTEGEGTHKTEKRTIGEFTGIDLSIPAELTVKKGELCSVEIEAQENLHELIRTKVRGSKLVIDDDRCISGKGIKIRVTLPELDKMELNGSGNIFIPDTFQVSKLNIEINGSGNIRAKLIAADLQSEIHGSGDIELAGSANNHKLEIMGSGNISASAMPCNNSDIQVNGSGDVHVYAIQTLEVHINGSGSVHYKGKPSVSTRINGSGKVVDEN